MGLRARTTSATENSIHSRVYMDSIKRDIKDSKQAAADILLLQAFKQELQEMRLQNTKVGLEAFKQGLQEMRLRRQIS